MELIFKSRYSDFILIKYKWSVVKQNCESFVERGLSYSLLVSQSLQSQPQGRHSKNLYEWILRLDYMYFRLLHWVSQSPYSLRNSSLWTKLPGDWVPLKIVPFIRSWMLNVFSPKWLLAAAAAMSPVVSDSVQPQRWQPTRLPRPWDSPGKNTGVGYHFLLQCMKVKSESEVSQSCQTLSDPMELTNASYHV